MEDSTVAGITDGMCAHLEIFVVEDIRYRIKMRRLAEQEAPPAGLVGIRFQQAGAAGTERAIGIYLETIHMEPVCFNGAFGEEIIEILFSIAKHYVEPHFELAAFMQAVDQFCNAVVKAAIVDGCEAHGKAALLCIQQTLFHLLNGRSGDMFADEIDGIVYQYAGEPAIALLNCAASERCAGFETCELKRFVISDGSMTINT